MRSARRTAPSAERSRVVTPDGLASLPSGPWGRRQDRCPTSPALTRKTKLRNTTGPARGPKNLGLARLQNWLITERNRSGLTLHALSRRTGYSVSTLSRTCHGDKVPTIWVVMSFAAGCGSDQDETFRLWARAEVYQGGGCQTPRPELISTAAELREGLRRLHRLAGSPPPRFLELRAQEMGLSLPRSTLSDLLGGVSAPRESTVLALIRVLGHSEKQTSKWLEAWQRSRQIRRPPRALLDMPPQISGLAQYRVEDLYRELMTLGASVDEATRALESSIRDVGERFHWAVAFGSSPR
ncbi:helix-turn-helix domain-containing protein [Kitasatospora sp. NPDC001119]